MNNSTQTGRREAIARLWRWEMACAWLICLAALAACGPEPRQDASATAAAAANATGVNAARTIEAVLALAPGGGGQPFTPTAIHTPTPNATWTAQAIDAALQTALAQAAAEETAAAHVVAAAAETQEAQLAISVAATVAAQATQAAAIAAAVAATQQARQATAIAQRLTDQPPTPTRTRTPTRTPHPTNTPRPTDTPWPTDTPNLSGELLENLRTRSRRSWVPRNYPHETDLFIAAFVSRLDEFRLPGLGVTTRTVTDALRRGGAEDRINAIVNQVWGDWLNKDVGPGRLDAYNSDPAQRNLSPFRQLVIRMIQGRQGRLMDNQQHALHSLLTRPEERHVWVGNMNGVIGAINRESFQWQ